jgi:hypothetical protein
MMKQIRTLSSIHLDNLEKGVELAKRIQTTTRELPGNYLEAFLDKCWEEIGEMSHHYNLRSSIPSCARKLQAV